MTLNNLMSKQILPSLLLFCALLCGAGLVEGAPRIKVLKLAVTNPTNELRLHCDHCGRKRGERSDGGELKAMREH